MQIVNGFVCQNCTDVEYAKKFIDPAHPKQGPADPKETSAPKGNVTNEAVSFGGSLAKLGDRPSDGASTAAGPPQRPALGGLLDTSA